MRTVLIVLAVAIAAWFIYRPALRVAQVDMAERSARGESNGVVYAVLLLPLVGPFVWLVARRWVK